MENFFIEDRFYSDLTELMEEFELYELSDVEYLPNSWSVEVEESKLEKMFVLDKEFIVDSIYGQIVDSFEDRFPENVDIGNTIENAIINTINIDKLNTMIPDMFYPSGNKVKITRTNLIEYIS